MDNEIFCIYKAGYRTSGKESILSRSFQLVFCSLWCKLTPYITKMWQFTIKSKCSTDKIYTDTVQSNLNCWNKFFCCKFYYCHIVCHHTLHTLFAASFCCSYCSPVHLNFVTVKYWFSVPIFIKILYRYSCFMPICLHLVIWTSLDSFHHILNNALLIFGLMSFGWLHTKTLRRVYETHDAEQGWEAVNPL
jgi:hypothetical protein